MFPTLPLPPHLDDPDWLSAYAAVFGAVVAMLALIFAFLASRGARRSVFLALSQHRPWIDLEILPSHQLRLESGVLHVDALAVANNQGPSPATNARIYHQLHVLKAPGSKLQARRVAGLSRRTAHQFRWKNANFGAAFFPGQSLDKTIASQATMSQVDAAGGIGQAVILLSLGCSYGFGRERGYSGRLYLVKFLPSAPRADSQPFNGDTIAFEEITAAAYAK